MTNVAALSATVVEATFSHPLDVNVAVDPGHYSITGSPQLPIQSILVTGPSTVRITVGTPFDLMHLYTLTVSGLMTEAGTQFSDQGTFQYTGGAQPAAQPTPVAQYPLAQLQPLTTSRAPVGDTGPVTVAVIAAGAAGGFAWMRRARATKAAK